MKKVVLCGLLGSLLTVSAVFAEHPGGWGLGVLGQVGWGRGDGGTLGGAALSLKAPALPVYWGLNLKIGSDYFSAGATGDFYFLDGLLIPIKGNDGFGYFIGVGGYLGFGRWRGGSYSWQGRNYNYGRTSLGLGARIPVGLNVVIPVSKIKFEAFLDVVPSLGLDFFFWDRDYIDRVGNRDVVGFGFNIGGEFGIRVWF